MLQYDKKEILNYIINIRRHLHYIPEIGTNLPQTQEYVIKKLEELKIEYKKNQKDSGVVAIIKSNNTNKKTVALRADMDALPMKEETDFEYKSTNENMHACGHDVHTAILLGVCKILSENKDILKNDVKFIFQTAEETGEGAKIMIEENALQNVDAIFGIHIGTIAENVESGQFVIQSGPLMAAVDRIVITRPKATTIEIIGRTKLEGIAIAETRQRRANTIKATPNQIFNFFSVEMFFCIQPWIKKINPKPPQIITPAHAKLKNPNISGTVIDKIHKTAATRTKQAPINL